MVAVLKTVYFMEKKFGLLGGKLGHSYSPLIHSMLGGYRYILYEKSREELKEFLESREWDGLNVTIPYKLDVLPYLNGLDETAERTGSVNTVVREGGGLKGYNTDYAGFVRMVRRSGMDVRGKKCLVLGSGGASHTVRIALSDMGAEDTVIISRSGDNNYGNIYRHADADIIVNTTPVGMFPDNGNTPLDLGIFENLKGVVDLIYNPKRTELIFDAEERGIPSVSGLSMLVSQAAESCRLFGGGETDDAGIRGIIAAVDRKMSNIVLVGMPGCGKTTVGMLLARKLGREFADTDGYICSESGRTPEEIINEDGEDAFREKESESVKVIGRGSGKVISTGGGVVTRECNYRPLKQNSVIIFLEKDVENLAENGRPLSKKYGNDFLYRSRLPQYLKFADCTVNADGDPEETADRIIEIYENTCN